MIRLREFNMAELEYFIDLEIEPTHDFLHGLNMLLLLQTVKEKSELRLRCSKKE